MVSKQLAWAQDDAADADPAADYTGTEDIPSDTGGDPAAADEPADDPGPDIPPANKPDKPKAEVPPATPQPKLPDAPVVPPKAAPVTPGPAAAGNPTPAAGTTPNPAAAGVTPAAGAAGATPAQPGATSTPPVKAAVPETPGSAKPPSSGAGANPATTTTPTTTIPTATTPTTTTTTPITTPTGPTAGDVSAAAAAPGSTDQQQQQPAADPQQAAPILLPSPDETAIEGITPTTPSACMTSALLEAMGAEQPAASAGCSQAAAKEQQAALQEYNRNVRGSSSMRQGMLGKGDSSFCVNHEGPEAGTDGSLTSNGQPPTFQSYDPACDDADAAANDPSCRPTAKFMDAEGDGANGTANGTAPSGPPPINFTSCTRGFLGKGSQARSVAIVMLKWRRQYYKTKEECCRAMMDFSEGCDCTWSGGWTWDRLPPLAAYSRIFTDECDGHPSLNRGYYDLSGGRVTFHSRLTVPKPWGAPEDDDGPADNSTADGNTTIVTDQIVEAAAAAPQGPPQLVQTENSYLDPLGVDVYGWVTLDGMRTTSGICRDWCGEAIAASNITSSDYNHIICLALYSSKAICDTCKENCGDADGTCPAETGITTGCGCGTCYYAWGGQTSCTKPSPPGIRAGLAAVTEVYTGEAATAIAGTSLADVMAGTAPPADSGSAVAPVLVGRSLKSYMAHEVGHNLGLTHTGSINCRYDTATIERDPKLCTPDWYGDITSFMGRGADMQLPNAIKYKVRWLPRATLRTHPLGTEAVYRLRPSTIRRPSKMQRLVAIAGEPTPPATPGSDPAQPGSSSSGAKVRWFDARQTLAVRIRLTRPDDKLAATSSYSCPCNPVDTLSGGGGYCPACAKSVPGACANGPCCLVDGCADGDLSYLYVELHQPYKDDYNPEFKGVALRMMGDASSCTSTRQVPSHLEKGSVKWLLWNPDPTGQAEGSKFEDPLRQVRVVLERWDRAQAIVRIWAG